jgi:FemAB-related protein (PEP-CTERM system-associated)
LARVRVEEVEPGEEWDAFVERAPGAHLGHAGAWAPVLRDAYALRARCLVARDGDGRAAGVLPLVEHRSLRGARELVSLPFHDVAGILASSEGAAEALVQEALRLTGALGCRALELRQVDPLPGRGPAPPAAASAARVNLVLPLERSGDAQWAALGAKVRNQVRKAEKEGLRLAEWPPERLLDGFYACFAENMRDLGSPVHGRALFAEAARRFGSRLRFVVAADGERPVGGLVAIHYAGRVTVTWASTLRSERARCPNNLIYWEAIRWAIGLRAGHFDFGRSPIGSGTYKFKRGWGAVEERLVWTRLTPAGEPVPYAPLSEDPVLARLSALWRRLPVGWSRRLGPPIRRRLSN